jgi:hypothetical protein
MASINHETLQILTQLPPPHGPLVAWLERKWMDEGQISTSDLLHAVEIESITRSDDTLKTAASWIHGVLHRAAVFANEKPTETDKEASQEVQTLIRHFVRADWRRRQQKALAAWQANPQDPQTAQAYYECQAMLRSLDAAST